MAEYDGKVFTGDKMKPVLDNLATEYTKKIGWGVCSTAAATAAKTVTIGSKKTESLTSGTVIAVKFTYAVPANATLNVNSLGAKNIRFRGANITANVIGAGQVVFLCYNGTQWDVIDTNSWREVKVEGVQKIAPTSSDALDFVGAGNVTVTYENNAVKINGAATDISGKVDKVCYGISSESSGTARTATIQDFVFAEGNLVVVKFGGDVPANSTLNINNGGAKAIYYNGVPLTDGKLLRSGRAYLFEIYNGCYQVLNAEPLATSTIPGIVMPGNGLAIDSTGSLYVEDVAMTQDPLVSGDNYVSFSDNRHGTVYNIEIPFATNRGIVGAAKGLVDVPLTRTRTATEDDATTSEGNALSIDSDGGLFLPVAHGNTIGAVAPGVGLSMGEGGHMELNQANSTDIGGMLLYNTIDSTTLNKTDGTLTASAIDRAIQAAKVDTAQFQGTVGTGTGDVLTPDSGNTPFSGLTDYKKGWYWVVSTPGTYTGRSCEAGDFIFCVADKGTGSYSSDSFTVVQNNIEIITTEQVTALWNAAFTS